jgi:hypothetical protein
MSEEMVERVARALADGAHCPSQCSTYCGDKTACVAHAAARAAIEAMRADPTQTMILAGMDASKHVWACDAESIWDAMITAALK